MIKRIAIFGGSFDPPHFGHLSVVLYLRHCLGFTKVLVVPVYEHPFSKTKSSFIHRFNMAEVAFSTIDGVEVSDIEKNISAPSYTVNTVKELISSSKEEERFTLILGTDIIKELPKWHDFDTITSLVDVIFLEREGLFPDISSTMIREAIKEKKEFHHLIPVEVARYIEKNRLYIS